MAERKKITPDTVVNPDFMDISDVAEDKSDCQGRLSLQSDVADERQESGLTADDGVDPYGATENREDENGTVDEELVEIIIPFDHVDSGKKFEKFSINLKEFIIPIGEPVMVPRYVRDYWLCLNKQKHKFGIARNALEGSALPENS